MLCKLQHCKHKRSLVMSFTEQDMKKQMEDFAALREEFSRLESQEKAMRKQLGLPEQGKTDPASLTPELRKMVEEAEAEARRAGEARAAQARMAARPAAAGGIPGGGRRNIVRL